MEQETGSSSSKLIIIVLCLNFCFGVCPSRFAMSPAPVQKAKEGMMVGSVPVACESKCNQCMPCMPVEVLIGTSQLEDDHEPDLDQYYPQVWRCVCQDQIFSP